MKPNSLQQFVSVLLAFAFAVTPVNAGQWVCSADGIPCPPQSHAGERGRVAPCCCDEVQKAPDCCGHEAPSLARGRCGDTDVFVITEQAPARTSHNGAHKTVAPAAQLPRGAELPPDAASASEVIVVDDVLPFAPALRSSLSRAPPSL